MAAKQDPITSIISEISATSEKLSNNEPGAREKLINLAYSLVNAAELPSEVLLRMAFAEPARYALCRTAVDLKIFETLAAAKGKSISTNDLASSSKAHPTLIARIMKHLSAMHIVSETGEDSYTSTPLSNAFTEPPFRDGIKYTYDIVGPSWRSMPTYLKSINYDRLTNLADGPFQYAHDIKGTPFWPYLAGRPEYLAMFSNYMGGYRAGKRSWLDPGFYPFVERILEGAEEDGVLVVDVGGGKGHDLLELQEKVPAVKGKKLVLQDQADLIASVEKLEGVDAMAHDFFTEQSVKGARAYYVHSVLHDWDDGDSTRILKRLVEAMKRGYSKLLISELVVPSTGATWSATTMDWVMMALGAAKERTESDWRRLLEGAGLKIVEIWTYEQGTESLIEAELA